MYEENPGEIDFGSSYRESTVLLFFERGVGVYEKPKNSSKNYPEPINSDRFQ